MERHKKIFKASIAALMFSLIMSFFGLQWLLERGIKDQYALRDRNMLKKIYLKLPMSLNFTIYFFNVTNPMEVQVGKKPILKQVGPYTYDWWLEKRDIVENEAEDSLTYSSMETFYFNRKYSAPRTEDDYITILNPLLVGMVNTVAALSPDLLNIVAKAIPFIFRNPQSIYITVKVKDLLFDGVILDCTSKNFATSAICTQIKTNVPNIKEPKKNIFLFSLIGGRNATIGSRVKVLRGIKRTPELGKVVEYDGKKELTFWGGEECNRFRGTDGWIFPPLTKKEDGLWTFSTDLCRSIQAIYEEPIVIHGMTANKFYSTLGDQAHNPDDQCYCPTPKTCLKKGVFDLTKCLKVPILATLPHFLEADEIYLTQVDGLKPDRETHIIRINFIQMIAVPLEVKIRIQFNFQITNMTQVALMKSIPTALHPILWLELGVELSGEWLTKVRMFFILLKAIQTVKILMILGSFGLMGYAGYLYNKNKQQITTTTSTVEPTDAVNRDMKEVNIMRNPIIFSKIMDKSDNMTVRNNLRIRSYDPATWFTN